MDSEMEQRETLEPTYTRSGLQTTIAGLRMCNEAQSQVIANLEEYERSILGIGVAEGPTPTGYSGGYAAELEYLHSRRQALEGLITAVERYGVLAESLSLDRESAEA